MSISSEILLRRYIPFNKPVPYKDLYIYPIRLNDMSIAEYALDLLQIEKNELGQIDFISMSNLRFFLLVVEQMPDFGDSLEYLLRKALKVDDNYAIQKYISDKDEFIVIGEISSIIDDEVFLNKDTLIKINREDFDEIRRIILYQTFPDYDDKYVDPDIKKKAEEYYRLKNKNAKKVSLEHKVICVQSRTGMTPEQIGDLTIRNFYQLFDVLVDRDDYIIHKNAEFNNVKFTDPIEHWAYKEKKDKYSEAFCDADSFISQVQSVN